MTCLTKTKAMLNKVILRHLAHFTVFKFHCPYTLSTIMYVWWHFAINLRIISCKQLCFHNIVILNTPQNKPSSGNQMLSKCKPALFLKRNNIGYFQSKKLSKGQFQVALEITSLKFPVTEDQTDLIMETQPDPIRLLGSFSRLSFY